MTRRAVVAVFVTGLLAVCPLCANGPAATGEELEYRVKAAFLYNFLKFIEWPAAGNADGPWVIGILGHDPFGAVLEQTVQGKVVAGRPIEIHRFARAADVKACSILFMTRADSERLGIPSQPGLLTVGEGPGFLKSGGIINFYIDDNRVHFEIRAQVAHGAGLRVSAQLLKLGRTL